MHRGEHDHHHHGGAGGWVHDQAPAGHNGPRSTTQWQTPHRAPGADEPPPDAVADIDLVEASFIEGWRGASDPTSFLRLAGVPFDGVATDGRRMRLLRVEIEDLTDVGSVTPLIGGAGYRYDPLPARFVSRRMKLAFAYHDGERVARLDFSTARALKDGA